MDWNDLRYFLALARTGSVRAAGAALGVSHSTVARRVEALEQELSARLFDRSRDGYALTEAGRQMVPHAERVEAELAALERGLAGQDERLEGRIVITCCDSYISRVVLPQVTAFCAAHPGVDIAFTNDSRPFDLSKREADLAIRIKSRGDEPLGYLLGRRLAPVVVANYVATAHADRLDPTRPGASTRWISSTAEKTQAQLVARSSFPDLPVWGSFSSLDLMVQASLEGLGLAMLPTYVGDQVPGLERLDPPDLLHAGDLWLLCHPDLRDNARLRAMRSTLTEVFRVRQALFRGGPETP